MKPLVLGHWGTTPGQNFIYVHLNRVIKKYDLDMIYVSGPGHGGPAVVGNTYLEGTYSEIYPNISQDEAGLQEALHAVLVSRRDFQPRRAGDARARSTKAASWAIRSAMPSGRCSTIPISIVACVVGDGEAETGPLATAWHSNKFLNPITDGAVLPILHLNGYKISNPTVLARIEHEELEQFLRGCGWTPYFVEGDEPEQMHELMAATLDTAIEQIRANPEERAKQRRHHSTALADDRPQVAQGLDRAEGRRWPASRGHLPRAPGAAPGEPGPSRSSQAAGRAG